MSGENQRKIKQKPRFWEVPAWARDNLVLRLLNNYGMRLEVYYDEKYLKGLTDSPVIVIANENSMKKRARKSYDEYV